MRQCPDWMETLPGRHAIPPLLSSLLRDLPGGLCCLRLEMRTQMARRSQSAFTSQVSFSTAVSWTNLVIGLVGPCLSNQPHSSSDPQSSSGVGKGGPGPYQPTERPCQAPQECGNSLLLEEGATGQAAPWFPFLQGILPQPAPISYLATQPLCCFYC